MAISSLQLINFRNHNALTLHDLDAKINIIVGPNGAGKTNILEALSLLAPGKGIRNAKTAQIFSFNNDGVLPGWAAHFKMHANDLRLASDTTGKREARQIKLNDAFLKSANHLLNHIRVVWLTPTICHLFTQNAEERRKFLDRMVYNQLPIHATLLNKYKKLTRSRMQLLKEQSYDPMWMSTLEEQIAEVAMQIMANRAQTIQNISQQLEDNNWGWAPQLKLLQNYNQNDGDYLDLLKQNRTKDAIIGRTMLGPHRDDITFTHSVKNITANNCSTGEHKNAVIKIIFAHILCLSKSAEIPIILLLDDIFAHIDDDNKQDLYLRILNLTKVQKWITATPDDISFLSNAEGGCNANIIPL